MSLMCPVIEPLTECLCVCVFGGRIGKLYAKERRNVVGWRNQTEGWTGRDNLDLSLIPGDASSLTGGSGIPGKQEGAFFCLIYIHAFGRLFYSK